MKTKAIMFIPVHIISIISLTTFCSLHLCQSFTLSLPPGGGKRRPPSATKFASRLSCAQSSSATKVVETVTTTTSTQTKQDVSMEQWHKEQGIICPNIEIRTTTKSVGGRGLFWKESKYHAKQGDILAYIPHQLVFEMSKFRDTFPELDDHFLHRGANDNEEGSSKSLSSSPSWPSIFTVYAYETLLGTKGKGNGHMWKTWIKLWNGGGPDGPRPSQSYTQEEISLLMKMIHNKDDLDDYDDHDSSKNMEETIRKVIDKRYRTFVRDLNSVKSFNITNEETFASLYSIILSRTASLGPQWQNCRGVIPLHDMINHPPSDGSKCKNVELFCVGDVQNIAGDEIFMHLFSSLLQSSTPEI